MKTNLNSRADGLSGWEKRGLGELQMTIFTLDNGLTNLQMLIWLLFCHKMSSNISESQVNVKTDTMLEMTTVSPNSRLQFEQT